MSVTWGTPLKQNALRILLLGSGELGKEMVIELQRHGIETIAADSSGGAPAHAVAHRHHIIDMFDPEALQHVIGQERPHFILTEVETVNVDVLAQAEAAGIRVVPNSRTVALTLNRESIRRLAVEELGIPAGPARTVSSYDAFQETITQMGLPCFVKPASSAHGQGLTLVTHSGETAAAWNCAAQASRRNHASQVIIEKAVDFDFEITLLAVNAVNGLHFCEPIGHQHRPGSYCQSWQPQSMSAAALGKAHDYAEKIVRALGGHGVFSVELFIKGDQVWFSEVSARPHDTGYVTQLSQNINQFALHVRAMLDLPVPEIKLIRPSACAVILAERPGQFITYSGMDEALAIPEARLRIFGKPNARLHRRLGLVMAGADTIETACKRACEAASKITLSITDDPPGPCREPGERENTQPSNAGP